MGVVFLGQAVVAQRPGGIAGAGEGPEEPDPERGSDAGFLQPPQEFLDFPRFAEIATGNPVEVDFFAKLPETGRIGMLMDPVDAGFAQLEEPGGDGFVSEEHELLDELMGLVVLDLLNINDPAPPIETKAGFRGREFK